MMRLRPELTALTIGALVVAGCGGPGSIDKAPTTEGSPPAAEQPGTNESTFVKEVDNPFFPLVAGMRWEYEVTTPEGSVDRLVAEVIDETRIVAGVETTTLRVTLAVEGELEEETFSWLAQDAAGNVWLFGEIDHGYEGESLVETTTWEAGIDGAEAGIVVPADPSVADEYRVGFVEGTMEEMARVVDRNGTVDVAAGSFDELLVIENWCVLEPDIVEQKYYAQGTGLVYQRSDAPDTDVVQLISFLE